MPVAQEKKPKKTHKITSTFRWSEEPLEKCIEEIMRQCPKDRPANRDIQRPCIGCGDSVHKGELYRTAISAPRHIHAKCISNTREHTARPPLQLIKTEIQDPIKQESHKYDQTSAAVEISSPESIQTMEQLQRYIGVLEGKLEVYEKVYGNIDFAEILKGLSKTPAQF